MTRDPSDPTKADLGLQTEFRVHVGCERFKETCHENGVPRIEDYLKDWQEPQRRYLFRELMRIECEMQTAAGQSPSCDQSSHLSEIKVDSKSRFV